GRMNDIMKLRMLCLAVFLFSGAASGTDPLPTVVVVTTGGTIAEKFDSATGGAVPAVSGSDLLAEVPGLDEIANVEVVEFCNIDSSHMTPEIWRNLSAKVQEILDRTDVRGVVVTHGTDTMAEGAFFLETTLESEKPVVFTGSMRNGSDLSPDGSANLYNAVLLVCSPEAAGWGVTVTLNQYINSARHVMKDNTTNIQTFDSGDFGYLGYITGNHVLVYNAVLEHTRIALPDSLPKVPLFFTFSGDDGSYIRFAVDNGASGIVIAGVGAGNVNADVYHAIEYSLESNIPVVICSRARHGEPEALYGDQGGGSSLVEAGALLAGDLSPFKARLLLMIALSQPGIGQCELRLLMNPQHYQ
ncbi:MAG: asparaginase, partial [Candidatus Fermentibacteria bacterium]|nr:asparaginase [Candidatus Fermentibacteria bacterium]